ncbi:membrane protein [Aliiroseovarius zhejiangensis]|uniref:Membrane protein n=1 Tax=Aliiroseovarius zhejiangensis TaxID=1632025 RepID=A0ABQ3ISK6_9RHOB|nr:DMT family transporter [Aliiroseovarius zhejiangensis]GHE89562.1 membrane protein [Aliiroseovarius zhejiangensis]
MLYVVLEADQNDTRVVNPGMTVRKDENDMSGNRTFAAAGTICLAMFLLGFFDNFVTLIAQDLGLWQFHLMRAIMAVGILMLLSRYGHARLAPVRLWAVMVRGGFAAVAMLIYFGCLAFLPIGQVAAGLFTAPIWVLLISALFLGQPVGAIRLGAAIVGFVGVLIVLDPFANGLAPLALVPMAAGFFYAIGGIATRQWCEGESALSMLLFFFLSLGLFGLIGSIAMTVWAPEAPAGADGFILRGLVWPTPLGWGLTVMQAVGSLVAVGLIFKGYQMGEAAQVAIYEYLLLPFAAGWSFVLFGDPVPARAIFGMALIIVSGAIISLRSRVV